MIFKYFSGDKIKLLMSAGWKRPVVLAFSLVVISIGVLLSLDLFGIRANTQDHIAQAQKQIVDLLVIQLTSLIEKNDLTGINYSLSQFVANVDQVRAADIIQSNDQLIAQYGDLDAPGHSMFRADISYLRVPIFRNSLPWAELRIVFEPMHTLWRDLIWISCAAVGFFVSFTVFFSRVPVKLDPGSVVPGGVDSAFNLFNTGVIVLDDKLRVVMVNQAVKQLEGIDTQNLEGHSLDELPWEKISGWQAPWATTLHSGIAISDVSLRLHSTSGQTRLFSVSCAFVGQEASGVKGVLVTLDDLTPIEMKNSELNATLEALQQSQASISEKNRELEHLATTDALTGIFNRRTLMERLSRSFEQARDNNTALSCLMTDIDHFKSVNDTYGHSVGDDVIQAVANTLKKVCRQEDTLGRYGGEEFVMVFPGRDAKTTAKIADKVRQQIFGLALGDRLAVSRLSSSFGVADITARCETGDAMVDAADQALYVAKQNGRNRVEIYSPDSGAFGEHSAPLANSYSEEHTESDLAQIRIAELEAAIRDLEHGNQAAQKTDSFTGLPVREVFLQKLETELTRAERLQKRIGVLSFEITNLPEWLGELEDDIIDRLILMIIQCLQNQLRTTDYVSLIMGPSHLSHLNVNTQEYVVILSDLSGVKDCACVLARLRRAFQKPMDLFGVQHRARICVGATLSSQVHCDAITILNKASSARIDCYNENQGFTCRLANENHNEQVQQFLLLEADLISALENAELELWYQPQFSTVEHRVTGVEALLRWKHAQLGYIPPLEFLAVAESSGLSARLNEYVLNGALMQMREWKKMGFEDLRAAVNLSLSQLRAEKTVTAIKTALQAHACAAKQLEIEVAESSLKDPTDEVHKTLNLLKDMGVTVSLDNYGIGLTTPSTLATLPVHRIKIDRSLARSMVNDSRNSAVVQSIVVMACTLDLEVVVEGVETNEELDILVKYGCNYIQGYLICEPRPASEITEFLVRQYKAVQRRRA